MLKIEDLKVGDELEFISEEDKLRFTNSYHDNVSMVTNCFPKGIGEITKVGERWVEFKGDHYRLKVLSCDEVKYFRKVETKKEVIDTADVETTSVNAGIISYEESYTRMMAGEVFYYKYNKVWFDKVYGNFMYGDKLLGTYKSNFTEYTVKKPWFEFASEDNPILCKVWDCDSDGNKYEVQYDLISGFDIDEQACYIGEDNCSWMCATPVKPSECFQGG